MLELEYVLKRTSRVLEQNQVDLGLIYQVKAMSVLDLDKTFYLVLERTRRESSWETMVSLPPFPLGGSPTGLNLIERNYYPLYL